MLDERSSVRFDPKADAVAPAPAEARGLSREDVRLLVASDAGVTHAVFRDLRETGVVVDAILG